MSEKFGKSNEEGDQSASNIDSNPLLEKEDMADKHKQIYN